MFSSHPLYLGLPHSSFFMFADCGSMKVWFSEPFWYSFGLYDLSCAGEVNTGSHMLKRAEEASPVMAGDSR